MPVESAKRAAAVEAAKEVFWENGYAEASIADIVAATGMNRYALYSEFGGKRELFLAALDAYFEECGRTYMPVLYDTSHPPLERIRNLFNLMIEEMSAEERGCLMCQTAIEVAREDEPIGAAVAEYFSRILDFLASPLAEAAEAGLLNPNLSPKDAAQLLFDTKLSLGVLARAGTPDNQLAKIVDITLAAISAPKTN